MSRGHDEEVLWLFDLGNTSLKGQWSRGGQSGHGIGIAWEPPDHVRELREQLAAWPAPDRVVVASVASDQRADHLRRALQHWPQARVEWLVTPRQGCGITSGYEMPERLGIDRFLAMAGARALDPDAAFVIVGCGTALTLDAVDANGRHCEGLIAPSPALMIRSLRSGTAIDETNPDAFKDGCQAELDDTHQAIQAGCWQAAVALIEAFHARHRAALGAFPVYLHGGGALTLKAAMDAHGGTSVRLLDDAVWRGLEVWAGSPPVDRASP